MLNALKSSSAMSSFFLQRRWPEASSGFPHYLSSGRGVEKEGKSDLGFGDEIGSELVAFPATGLAEAA